MNEAVLDWMIVLAGAGAALVIGQAAIRVAVRSLGYFNRRVDEARELFGDVPLELTLSFPLPPSLEYLPKVYGRGHDVVPFTPMPGSVVVEVEPVEAGLFNFLRKERDLVARLRLKRTNISVAVVMRRSLGRGRYYRNGLAQHGCDLVVGMDSREWKRPFRQADKVKEVSRAVLGSRWLYAGGPCKLEWRRCLEEYVEYEEAVALHPSRLVEEFCWVLTRDGHPMSRAFDTQQKASINVLWMGNSYVPYYLIYEYVIEEGSAVYQALERSVAFELNAEDRWGERHVEWEGPKRKTFAEAARDLYGHYGNMNCSPVYARSDLPVFRPLQEGEMRRGYIKNVVEHLWTNVGSSARTACGLLGGSRYLVGSNDEMLEYARTYKAKSAVGTLGRYDRLPCRECYEQALNAALQDD